MTSVWLLLASLALAQEELPKLEAEVKHRANPTFPHGASAGPLGTVRCVVRAVVQPDGRPSEAKVVEDSDCPEPFAGSASDSVMRWRWEPIEQASWVKVAVPFRLRTSLGGSVAPEDLAMLVEAHDVRPDDQEACRIFATLHPDGKASGLTTNRSPGCLAVPTLALPPRRLAKKAAGLQVRCTVSFRVNPQGAWVTAVGMDCPRGRRRGVRLRRHVHVRAAVIGVSDSSSGRPAPIQAAFPPVNTRTSR